MQQGLVPWDRWHRLGAPEAAHSSGDTRGTEPVLLLRCLEGLSLPGTGFRQCPYHTCLGLSSSRALSWPEWMAGLSLEDLGPLHVGPVHDPFSRMEPVRVKALPASSPCSISSAGNSPEKPVSSGCPGDCR